MKITGFFFVLLHPNFMSAKFEIQNEKQFKRVKLPKKHPPAATAIG